jgi:hypothetical protein
MIKSRRIRLARHVACIGAKSKKKKNIYKGNRRTDTTKKTYTKMGV